MIQLSDNFNYKRLLKFTFPTIIMLVISSIYGVVDGYFVSNFVGKTAFTAVNFIMPFLLILGCVGFLFGTGGGALIAKTMGEGKKEEANEQFSLLIVTSAGCGIILAVLGIVTMPWIASAMGADGQLLTDSILYGCVVIIAIPAYILQCEFQCLFATAEKPKLGLYVAIMAGITNIVLDALFITVFKWGLVGAALATAIGQYVGGIIPLLYFSRQNNSLLKFKKPKFDCDVLKKTVANGSSELMTNVSTSVVSMLYNAQLLKYAGEDGVASYGVLLYVALLFQAVFIGYSVGTAPIISYHYGAKNYDELKNLRKRSLIVIICFAVFMFIIGEFLSKPIAFIFVGYDNNLMEMTLRAFMIYSFSFLFSGFGVFGSSFFTALNEGLTSALIAFMRILVFQVVSVLIFPIFWGVNGIWFSIVGAEILATIMTAFFIVKNRKISLLNQFGGIYMSLTIQKVTSYFKDLEKFEELNNEAFPDEERMSIQEMLNLVQSKKIEVSALYDKQQFIGFYVLVIENHIGYILFLAISPEQRSKGYGGKALSLMKKQYPNCQIVLDMETIEDSAPNLQQRILRKQFYLQNGFYETEYLMEYKGLEMEVLCNQKTFQKNEFETLLKNLKIREIPFHLWKK